LAGRPPHFFNRRSARCSRRCAGTHLPFGSAAPVFQDHLLSTSLTIGGPAEIAYFAQSQVLFDKILGRMTPAEPRFSGTLIEPRSRGDSEARLDLRRLFGELPIRWHSFSARAPFQSKQAETGRAGNALDGELQQLERFMAEMDEGSAFGHHGGEQDALSNERLRPSRIQLPIAERSFAQAPC